MVTVPSSFLTQSHVFISDSALDTATYGTLNKDLSHNSSKFSFISYSYLSATMGSTLVALRAGM
jgi:hypothetical protein